MYRHSVEPSAKENSNSNLYRHAIGPITKSNLYRHTVEPSEQSNSNMYRHAF